MSNHYKTLNVSEDASIEEIRKSYIKLALKYHPDKNKDTSELFKKIVAAYAILSDSKQRSKYDRDNGIGKFRSFVREPVNGFKIKNTLEIKISVEEFIKRDTITVQNIRVLLPNYITPYLEVIDPSTNEVHSVSVKFTDNKFKANRFVFEYGVINGMACTVLKDDKAYKRVKDHNVAITPFGPSGIVTKIIEYDDHFLLPDMGLPVQNSLGVVMKSILIISKK